MWEWVFDGIGTELVSLVIGAILGGIVGYKVAVKKNLTQKQKAGDNSKQKQIIDTNDIVADKGSIKVHTKSKQKQEAGDNSTQVQIGRAKDAGK